LAETLIDKEIICSDVIIVIVMASFTTKRRTGTCVDLSPFLNHKKGFYSKKFA